LTAVEGFSGLIRRIRKIAGIALAIVSVAALALPLAVIFMPLIGNASGLYKIGISVDETGLRFMAAAGMIGGAGAVASIWLLAGGKRRTD